MNPLIALAVFTSAAILDVVWARYTIAVTDRRPLRAANLAVALYAFGAYGILVYTEEPAYIVPMAAGSWAGTYIAVRRGAATA